MEAAVREARRWGGHDRWVLQETLDYVDLLLTYVRERIAHEGRLTSEVSAALADPALDLLGELRDVGADEQHPDYATMIDCELAELLSPASPKAPQVVTAAGRGSNGLLPRLAWRDIAAILRAVADARGDER